MDDKGIIIVNTGNGKGKTTAALGTAFRSAGHGYKVCVIQFIKGKGEYGERKAYKKFDNIDWYIQGEGFVWKAESLEKDKKTALEGFELAKQKVLSDEYDLVVLDEITYLPKFNFLSVESIISLLKQKPKRLNIIITGRDASKEIIEIADTVTEMKPIKHAFDSGIKAKKGIEF